MDVHNFKFKKNKSLSSNIKKHLVRCDNLFEPHLSSYIDLDAYSKKIFEKASRYEVFYNDEMIGLAAIYISNNNAFISNFSVENTYVGKGLAKQLMDFCIEDLSKLNISAINLEVFKANQRAIKFYSKFDFNFKSEDAMKYTLIKYLEYTS